MKQRFLNLATLVFLIGGCDDAEQFVCEPIEQDTTCIETVVNYSVCCDDHYMLCWIYAELDDSLEDPRDNKGGPESLPCGSYLECQKQLNELEQFCLLEEE